MILPLEQNRDNIQVIIEGQLNAYIPTNANTQQEEQAQAKAKKKYIHTLHEGQCINLLTASFKKITSFYFDCQDSVSLLNIPCVVNDTSIITQLYPLVKAEYDFIFETLIQFDQFYTQQQVRDILFVSRKFLFKKGNIQLKHNGLIAFVFQGEFTIFKDFFKDKILQKDFNSIQQNCKKENILQKNDQFEDSEDDDDDLDDESLQTKKGDKTLELQNLKMKFKKKDSQVFKRIRLGIKKPGALIVLGRKDHSVDGIECEDSHGVAFICTEEQYESITKEQERKSDATQAQLVQPKSDNQLLNLESQVDKKGNEQNKGRKSLRPQSGIVQKAQPNQPFSSERLPSKINIQDENDMNNTSLEQIDDFDDDTKQSQQSNVNGKKDTSKGNMLRSKNELDYRKLLINNIGQQLNAFGNFFYTNRKQQNQTNQIPSNQQQKIISNRNSQKNITDKIGISQPSQNQQIKEQIIHKQILTEQDEEMLKEYLTPRQPHRRLTKKKTATLINPLYESLKNTLRGSSSNIQPQGQGSLSRNNSQVNIDRSDSPPQIQEVTLQRDTSIMKIEMNKIQKQSSEVNKLNRSKSAFQPPTPSSQSANNTPARKLTKNYTNAVQFFTTDSPSEGSSSPSKLKNPKHVKVNTFTPQNIPIIDLKEQTHRSEHHHSVSNYIDYNFMTSTNENNTPSQTNSPSLALQSGNGTNTFTENYASIFSKTIPIKKSYHYTNQASSQNNTPRNNKIQLQRKLQAQTNSSKPLQLHRMKIKTSEINGSQSQRQFSTNSFGEDQNSTLNFGNLSQYHVNKEKTQQSEQLPLKSIPHTHNMINSLVHLPTSKTITNISTHEISSSVLKIDSRIYSAKSQRVQSARQTSDRTKSKTDLNIFKLNYDQATQPNNGSSTLTNRERLQNKNIMQILYPQKMKKLDKQTSIITTQVQNKQTDNLVTQPSSTTNIKSKGGGKSIEQEFQLFLQKKLRPQSTLNRTQGEKQINILNKRVLGQFVQSLNNTPQNQQQQKINNFQSPKADQKTKFQQFQTFSHFSQHYNKNKDN